jgi:hypothetical protein
MHYGDRGFHRDRPLTARETEMTRTKPTRNRRALILFGAVAISIVLAGFLAMKSARHLGNEEGERSVERLSLVWPSFRSMPVDDRALLAGLSLTCRVQDRPAVKSAVIACLQEAAADPRATLPKGFDRSRGQARLEELLRLAAA